ncbi:MAG: ATP-dependent Clp protease ATP-binding subunit [Xanthomonadales bacterium]|nr:ATP-dependent Clp protease ATP-binding subunit [Xanthomonadales bacterium]
MKQFLEGSDQAYAELFAQARGACVRFRQQLMPPGCEPAMSDIGFEGGSTGQQYRLYVRPVSPGPAIQGEVCEWLHRGERSFGSSESLQAWIRGPLSAAFRCHSVDRGQSTADGVTDMDIVRAQLKQAEPAACYVDAAKLERQLAQKVRGQEHATRQLARTVARQLARLQPARPAVLFAVGPSGVGKTRSAEVLAEALSNLDDSPATYRYLRLDMNEYQEAHRVSQLLGAPQGYVGYGDGSQLLDTLAAEPRTIVLFDEIEKAHPSILRVLMNAMDQGRLSSPGGNGGTREVDCRSAIFIFTSNLRAEEILANIDRLSGRGNSVIEDEVCRRNLLAAQIPAEIVGRIGRFLVFHGLDAEARARIVADCIVATAAEYGLSLQRVSPFAVVEVMKKACGRSFGARPERYSIDELYGAVFAAAGGKGVTGPLALIGPPYAVVPASDSDSEG